MRTPLFLGALAFLACGSVQAQLPVSTAAEDKNAVLEEYTGIKCIHCPDGHLRATNLAESNPGRVVLINIHRGSFATPQGNEPDFRTTEGTLMTSGAGISGYPAGSINRRVFPQFSQRANGMAMSRGDWAAAANTVMQEPSYVNMALEGVVNPNSRELTIDVEAYYTDDVPEELKLFVILLQDSLEGPQTGSHRNPGQVLPNGNYNHMHMFRAVIPDRYGEILDTSAQGVISKRMTYSVPEDINGVDVKLKDLSLAGFIAEGNVNIITGVNGPVTEGFLSDKPERQLADLKVYPNPASDVLKAQFELQEPRDVRMSIRDMSGKLLQEAYSASLPAGSHVATMRIDHLPKGVYMLESNLGNETNRQKIIVQ